MTTHGGSVDDVYIPGGLRPIPANEYFVDECITNGQDGYITLANVSNKDLKVSKNKILVRLVNCFEEIIVDTNINVMLSQINEERPLFTANDISYNDQLTSEQITILNY